MIVDRSFSLSELLFPHPNVEALILSSQSDLKVNLDNVGKGLIIAPGTDTMLIKCYLIKFDIIPFVPSIVTECFERQRNS